MREPDKVEQRRNTINPPVAKEVQVKALDISPRHIFL